MKIVELLINELDKLSGFDAVALVEEPAIEADFFAFKSEDLEDIITLQLIKLGLQEQFVDRLPGESRDDYLGRCIPQLISEGYDEDQAAAICYDTFDVNVAGLPDYINQISSSNEQFDSYTDYPESATNAAKRALEWRDSHPDQGCGTRVGWARANQLAKREPISEDTIARMASFARHLQHEDIPYSEGCGGLMVDAWGGRSGIEWAQRKLDDIREENNKESLAFTRKDDAYHFALNVDEQVVVGPLMIPDKLILRIDQEGNPYHVFFSKDTVKAIANKMMRSKLLDKMNIEHNPDRPVEGYMMETWIVEDSMKDKSALYGFDLPEGTWVGMYKVENEDVWELVKQKQVKGFSIEGFFSDKLVQAKKENI